MRIVAGGMAGGCASTATYPLDLIRTRLTLQGQTTLVKYNGILHALTSVAKTEGIIALYKGIGTTLAVCAISDCMLVEMADGCVGYHPI